MTAHETDRRAVVDTHRHPYLDHPVHIPRYRPVGWLLTIGPVVLVAAMSGTALIATTGIGSGVLLLGTAAAGFHDLAGVRSAARQADRSRVGRPATTGARP